MMAEKKRIILILFLSFMAGVFCMNSDDYKNEQSIREYRIKQNSIDKTSSVYAVREGLYLNFNGKSVFEFLACNSENNFKKYMKTFEGNSENNYIKPLIESGNCVFLSNSPKSEYFIKVSKVSGDGRKVLKVMKEDFFGNTTEYYTDISPSSNILISNKPNRKEYERYINSIKEYNNTKRGKESSFDVGRVLCENRKTFNDAFFNDKMEIYRKEKKCLLIQGGTKFRYEEMGEGLLAGYTVLSGVYKGKKLYGFQ